MFKSIRTRLLAQFTTLAIAPLIFATAILFWHEHTHVITSEQRSQNEASKRLALQLSNFFTAIKIDLQSANRYQRLIALDRTKQFQTLSALLANRSRYRDILLVDGYGQEILFLSNSDTKISDIKGELTAATAFLLSNPTMHCYAGTVTFDKSTGEPFTTIAVPLKGLRTGLPEGVIFATVKLKAIWEMIGAITLPKGEVLYLLDTKNRLIAHHNPSLVLQESIVSIDPKRTVQKGINGAKAIVAMDSISIGGQTYKVVAEKSLLHAFTETLNRFFIITFIALLALSGALYLAILTFQQIIQPVESVSKALQEIKDGNLQKRLKVQRQDEIGRLAQSVNSMTQSLQQAIGNLKDEVGTRKAAEQKLQKAHEELEVRVEERTKELALSNRTLQENINERLQAEHELQEKQIFLNAVLENIEDGIVACNNKGVLMLFNRATREFHGLPEEPLAPDKWAEHYDLYYADGTTLMKKEDIPLFQAFQGKHIQNSEMVISPKQGKNRVLLASGQPFYDAQGEKLGAVVSMHDVTEKKLAEEILNKVHRELEIQVEQRTIELQESNKKLAKEIAEREEVETKLRQAHKIEAIATMAGGIAHDFNNILASVIGYADMAKDEIADNNPAKFKIEQVLKAGNRARDLIRHILTISRMSKPFDTYVPITLSSLVKEVMEVQRSIIPTTITIKCDIDDNCGQIMGDSTQIHHIILNLCSNAAHAMEKKGGILTVGLHQTELFPDDIPEPTLEPGVYIRLSVSDSGLGVSPEIINKIFDPYFTTKEVGKGSGMGLAVVRGIVQNHGGFINVTSEPSKGTIFHVFFPKIPA